MRKVSVILPAYAEGTELLCRTLQGYALQTASRDTFEVVVADDGGITRDVREIAEGDWNFGVRYVLSPRLRGSQVAHKNHARNAGWQAATGSICFICDCDCLVPPDFLEHLRAAWDLAESTYESPFCLYPMIACLDRQHADWIERHGLFSSSEDFAEFLGSGAVSSHCFGGNYSLQKLKAAELFSPLHKHPEGFPVIRKDLLAYLGGFDEEFIGWGGNKQEFQDRINGIPQIEKLLLHHCAVYHQAHPRRGGDAAAIDGYGLLNRRRSERKTSPKWRRAKERALARAEPPLIPRGGSHGLLDQWLDAGKSDADRLAAAGEDMTVVRRTLCAGPDDERPILFFGPWIGEFGWEAARWQGGVRKLATGRQKECRIIVAGDPGHHPFYEYADEYWWTPGFFRERRFTRDCHEVRPHRDRESCLAALKYVLARELALTGEVQDLVVPRRFEPEEQEHVRLTPSAAAASYRQQLIGRGVFSADYVCVLPRRRELNPEKNWGAQNWLKLCELMSAEYGLSVIVLGGEEDTERLERDDCVHLLAIAEDRKLDVNIAMFQGARFAVGSEGGGLLLSLLCGTPTFMFGHNVWQERLTRDENFLDTPCMYLGRPDNKHSYDEVAEGVRKFMRDRPAAEPSGRAVPEPECELERQIEARLEPEHVTRALTGLPYHVEGDLDHDWFIAPNYYPYYAAIASVLEPRRVLEVGTRLGYALVAMLVGFPGVERVVSVDDESEEGASQTEAEANVRSLGYAGETDFLAADSLEALDALAAYDRFDLVHLDADVARDRVETAVRRAWQLLSPGGCLLVDDVSYIPGVGSAFETARYSLRGSDYCTVLPTLRGLGLARRARDGVPKTEGPSQHSCVLCGGRLETFCVKDGGPIFKCQACRLVQVVFPDQESRSEWLSLYQDRGRYHLEYQMAGHASFVHRYLHDRRLARIRMENLLRHRRRGRLLDVGCSNGALVKTAQEYGFDAEGIDADAWVVERARRVTGCRIEATALRDLVPARKYDVVTVIDTLEHLLDPQESMLKIRSLLKASGLLVLEMPDASEPGFTRMGVDWKHLKPAEHAYYFGRQHIEQLLGSAGFRLIDSIVPYPDRRVYYCRASRPSGRVALNASSHRVGRDEAEQTGVPPSQPCGAIGPEPKEGRRAVRVLKFVVPPGIGDISWVYSKLASLRTPLHFTVARGEPRRALPYLDLLPLVEGAEYGSFSTAYVLKEGHRPRHTVVSLVEASSRSLLPLQLNTHLEQGERIEDYVRDLPVQHHYSMRLSTADVAAADQLLTPWRRFVTFCCANKKTVNRWKGWQAREWAELASLLAAAYELDGIAIVGAEWDREMAAGVVAGVKGGIPVKDFTGKLPLAGSLHVVRRGLYAVAFPSGLPILAAVMNCPVLMFYPEHLIAMQNAWADPEMIESGRYKGCQFCAPEEVFHWIRDEYKPGTELD